MAFHEALRAVELNRTLTFMLRTTAMALFVVYVLWNVFWLAQWKIPPSLFVGFTGLPGPTTGGTRSFLCLMRGQWQRSLAYNVMTVPILSLLVFNVAVLIVQAVRRRRLRLPDWMLWAWMSLLGIAWFAKLSGLQAYW